MAISLAPAPWSMHHRLNQEKKRCPSREHRGSNVFAPRTRPVRRMATLQKNLNPVVTLRCNIFWYVFLPHPKSSPFVKTHHCLIALQLEAASQSAHKPLVAVLVCSELLVSWCMVCFPAFCQVLFHFWPEIGQYLSCNESLTGRLTLTFIAHAYWLSSSENLVLYSR